MNSRQESVDTSIIPGDHLLKVSRSIGRIIGKVEGSVKGPNLLFLVAFMAMNRPAYEPFRW